MASVKGIKDYGEELPNEVL